MDPEKFTKVPSEEIMAEYKAIQDEKKKEQSALRSAAHARYQGMEDM
tara:strand:+ start:4132 stop:4272 length:141 start_codon:yes stop_codon:yes gene_type:complete